MYRIFPFPPTLCAFSAKRPCHVAAATERQGRITRSASAHRRITAITRSAITVPAITRITAALGRTALRQCASAPLSQDSTIGTRSLVHNNGRSPYGYPQHRRRLILLPHNNDSAPQPSSLDHPVRSGPWLFHTQTMRIKPHCPKIAQ